MKGQVFVAGAFMIALVLVLFAVSLSTNLVETEAPYKGYLAESIAAEYGYALGANSVKQFTEHVDGKISGFESVYAKIARTESGYDIVIGNYLGDKIDVSIEATNSDPEQVSGSVQKDSEGFFAFVSSGTSEITIEYKTPIKSWTESLTTSQGDNEKMLYDFVLIDDSSEIRRKGLVEG